MVYSGLVAVWAGSFLAAVGATRRVASGRHGLRLRDGGLFPRDTPLVASRWHMAHMPGFFRVRDGRAGFVAGGDDPGATAITSSLRFAEHDEQVVGRQIGGKPVERLE